MQRKLDKIIVYVMAAMLVLVVGMLYFFIFENDTVEFGNIPFPVDQQQYEAGGGVVLTIEECSDTPERYTYDARLVDNENGESRFLTSVAETANGEGCNRQQSPAFEIPDVVDPGKYYILLEITSNGLFGGFRYNTARSVEIDIM